MNLPAYVTDDMLDQIRRYVKKCAPQEGCGLIIRTRDGAISFKPYPNTHATPNTHFKIDARAVAALHLGNIAILAIVHNHPLGSADASAHDLSTMNEQQRPFLIVGMDGDVQWHEPQRAPLVGRDYVHGTQDCYGIVRDYYARELGIVIPDHDRQDRWWENGDSPSLYVENFINFGFVEVPKAELRKHDVLLCRWGQTHHINHALIYLADDGNLLSEKTDPCVGTRLCLHHPYNNRSGRFILGDSRLDSCELVVRHGTML